MWTYIYVVVGKHPVGKKKASMEYSLVFILLVDYITVLQRIGLM